MNESERKKSKVENAVEYFNSGGGYNCAQAVFGAFCEDNENGSNGLDKNIAFRIANGFGGGMRFGEVCGAVTGAIMVIGLKCGFYIEKDFAQKGFCYRKTEEFIDKFKQENNSIICRDILGADINSPDDFKKPEMRELFTAVCPKMIMSAVRILEKMEFERI